MGYSSIAFRKALIPLMLVDRVLRGSSCGIWMSLGSLSSLLDERHPVPGLNGQQSLLLANTPQDLIAALGQANDSYFTDTRDACP